VKPWVQTQYHQKLKNHNNKNNSQPIWERSWWFAI
jgi:hypothetical protein